MGLNVSASQVSEAREKVQRMELEPFIDLRLGSATEIDLPEASVDRIIALECAFHFRTRKKFLTQAFRSLQPLGCIALGDLVSCTPWHDLTWIQKRIATVQSGFWHIPLQNYCTLDEYRQTLQWIGFTNIQIEDISEHVFSPLRHYALTRLSSKQIQQQIHPLHRNSLSTWLSVTFLTHAKPLLPMRYLIITADKLG